MNVKLHTPKTLKTGSGLTSVKQFLLSIVATSISIALTFGTAAVVDYNKKQAAKKEMVMMVISDFDKTIELVENVDSGLLECRRLQHEIAKQPELFDSLRYQFASRMSWIDDEYSETVENIFSTSIETFRTIGDVNFVNEVSEFYLVRHKFKQLIDEFRQQWMEKDVMQSFETLLSIDFPEYCLMNQALIESLKSDRDRCMQTANVTDKDLANFKKKQFSKEVNQKEIGKMSETDKMAEEYFEYEDALQQAREKLKK